MSSKVYVVAEMSASHLGDYRRALAIVRAAARAGADGVKLQCWTPDTMAFPGHVISSGPWAGRDLVDLYREAFTPWEWFPKLFAQIRRHGMRPSVSVFDLQALEYLEGIKCPAYKISSFEAVDLGLIEAVSATGKPLAISTGMMTHNEMLAAYRACPPTNRPLLLRCVSDYSGEAADDANLAAITGAEWGVSDHSPGWMVPVIATARGAAMVEKHLNLNDRAGLDGGFALTPNEFGEMVSRVRQTTRLLGDGWLRPSAREADAMVLRRSLHARRPIRAFHRVTAEDVCIRRPASGMPISRMGWVLQCHATRDIAEGEPLTEEVLG